MATTDMKAGLQARQAVTMQRAKLILDTAEREGRGLNDDEKKELKALEASIDGIATRLERMDNDAAMNAEIARLTGDMKPARTAGPRPGGMGQDGSIGQRIIASELGQWLLAQRGKLPTGKWTSPVSSEIAGYGGSLWAATITSDAASGGDLIVTDYQRGIVPLPQRELTIADLLAQGTTDSNMVGYMKETSVTNAAAPVAEGAEKPESTIIFDGVTDHVRKIATWIPVTDEMLEDVPAFRTYLDARLRLFVQLAETISY